MCDLLVITNRSRARAGEVTLAKLKDGRGRVTGWLGESEAEKDDKGGNMK